MGHFLKHEGPSDEILKYFLKRISIKTQGMFFLSNETLGNLFIYRKITKFLVRLWRAFIIYLSAFSAFIPNLFALCYHSFSSKGLPIFCTDSVFSYLTDHHQEFLFQLPFLPINPPTSAHTRPIQGLAKMLPSLITPFQISVGINLASGFPWHNLMVLITYLLPCIIDRVTLRML